MIKCVQVSLDLILSMMYKVIFDKVLPSASYHLAHQVAKHAQQDRILTASVVGSFVRLECIWLRVLTLSMKQKVFLHFSQRETRGFSLACSILFVLEGNLYARAEG